MGNVKENENPRKLTPEELDLLAKIDRHEREYKQKLMRFTNKMANLPDHALISYLNYFLSDIEKHAYGVLTIDIEKDPEHALSVLNELHGIIRDDFARSCINIMIERARHKIAKAASVSSNAAYDQFVREFSDAVRYLSGNPASVSCMNI